MMFINLFDADIVVLEIHLVNINLQRECFKIKFDNDNKRIVQHNGTFNTCILFPFKFWQLAAVVAAAATSVPVFPLKYQLQISYWT